ncbi:MAG: haloalkane dehalogenase, partial [SAR324 cluster bacterium]|nr:haloalkane dehalogenase [SAR324 cluster bacterium]
LVPDLIGMGESDPLPESGPNSYRFMEHAEFLGELLQKLEVHKDAILVGHDWGGALLFHWAMQHPDAVQGIVYMETIVSPVSWRDWPEDAKGIFQGMRSEAGEKIVLQKNLFVEGILPNSVLRKLTEEEMNVYRKPFLEEGERRRPMLTWPREIPIEGEPEDVCSIVTAYGKWLQDCEIPKLFINAEPGSILTGRQRQFCRRFRKQHEVTVKGSHFIQEDSPDEIGTAIAEFTEKLRQT